MVLLLLPLAFAVEDFEGLSFYFGDLHSHTGGSNDGASGDLADCDDGASCGDYARWATIARDENDLDFAAVVDHVNSVTNAADELDWPVVFASVVAGIDRTTGFVGIPGAEVHFEDATTGDRYGHKSLLLFGDAAALTGMSIHDLQPNGDKSADVEGCAGIGAYYDRLVAAYGDALLLPHHPAADQPMSTDWTCHEPRYEPAVEVYSEHGNSMIDDPSGFDPIGTRYDPNGTVTAALDPARFGLRMGFFGGSDNHDSHPGKVCGLDEVRTEQLYSGALTVVVAPAGAAFTRATVHDALVSRQTYATTGPHLPVHLTWSQGGTLGTMGEELTYDPTRPVAARVAVPAEDAAAVLSVTLVGPDGARALAETGDGEWTGEVPADEVGEWLYVDVEIDGALWWVAVGGCEDGGGDVFEHVWLSPTWFAAGEPGGDTGDTGADTGGDTAGETGGDTAGETGGETGESGAGESGVGDSGETDEPGETGDTAAKAGGRGCGCTTGGGSGIPGLPLGGLALAGLAAARRRYSGQ